MRYKFLKIIYFLCILIFTTNVDFANVYNPVTSYSSQNATLPQEIVKILKNNLSEYDKLIYNITPIGVVVSVSGTKIFDEKEDIIHKKGKGFLTKFGQVLKLLNKPCVVESNISTYENPMYNLENSIIRAEKIAQYIVENVGVDPQKIRAMGFGELSPLINSDSNKNRIDFVIINYYAQR